MTKDTTMRTMTLTTGKATKDRAFTALQVEARIAFADVEAREFLKSLGYQYNGRGGWFRYASDTREARCHMANLEMAGFTVDPQDVIELLTGALALAA